MKRFFDDRLANAMPEAADDLKKLAKLRQAWDDYVEHRTHVVPPSIDVALLEVERLAKIAEEDQHNRLFRHTEE